MMYIDFSNKAAQLYLLEEICLTNAMSNDTNKWIEKLQLTLETTNLAYY